MTARNAKPQKPAPRRAGGDAARAAAPHSKQESLIREALVLFPKDRAGAVRRLLAAVEESQAAGDPAAGAWALQILSDVELMAGNPDRALELARQGHDRALRSGDRRALANSLDSLGRLEQQRGDLDAAIGRFSEALGLREQSGRDRDIAFTCNNLSLACREKGDLARAIELQMRALAIRERLGDAAGAATSHLNIGVIYVDLGDWDKALESYLRALTEHERQQDKANVAVCCNNIAEVYLRRGKPGRAQAYLDRALVLSDEAQMAWVRAEVTGSLGEAAFVAGDLARAEVLYEQDRRLCADTGNREELCETLRRMAELYLVQGRAAEAGSALAEAAACGQTGVEAGNVERVRGELAAQAGSREEGLATLRRSVELLRPLGRGYELARALLSLGRVLAADGRGQPELEEAEAVFVDLGAADRASEARGLLAGTRPAPVRPDLLQSLTGLAVRGTGRGPFCREALDLLVRSLDAVGGAVLLRDGTVVQAGKAAASRGAATAALEAGGRRLGTLVLSGAVEAGRFRALADVVALGLAQREPAAASPAVPAATVQRRHPGVVGAETTLREVFDTVERVASTRASVLILGESGTGKEVVAREMHRISDRSGGPFVAVNCAAIPEALLESELFGVEKGTATGVSERRGRFETADKGTVFLDEIGDMSLALQAKMLRVLQDCTFERVGGRRPVTVDVRVVAATNRELEAEMERGTFRRDLFYRLNVITLRLPALRERRADIPELVRHFCFRFSSEYGKSVDGADDDCLARLVAHDWPGNVRELENVVERGVILACRPLLAPEDLPPALQPGGSGPAGRPRTGRSGEERDRAVRAALDETGWNVSKAARRLGISRRQLHRIIAGLGLSRPSEPT